MGFMYVKGFKKKFTPTCSYHQMLPECIGTFWQSDDCDSISNLCCASVLVHRFRQKGFEQIGGVMHLSRKPRAKHIVC